MDNRRRPYENRDYGRNNDDNGQMRFRNNDGHRDQPRGYHHNRDNRNNDRDGFQREEKRCFNCKELGHIAKMCKQPNNGAGRGERHGGPPRNDNRSGGYVS